MRGCGSPIEKIHLVHSSKKMEREVSAEKKNIQEYKGINTLLNAIIRSNTVYAN